MPIVCSSGSLAILSAPQGGSSSISCVACNSTSGPKSLLALATAAGKSTPVNMSTCWYGYNNEVKVSPSSYSGIAIGGATCPVTICAPAWNTVTPSTTCGTMLSFSSPITPSPTGVVCNVTISANGGVTRNASVVYTDIFADVIPSVTFVQLGVTYKCVTLGTCTTNGCGTARIACQSAANTVTPALSGSESYCVCVAYNGSCSISTGCVLLYACVSGGGGVKLSCLVLTTCVSSSLSFTVTNPQTFTFCVTACKGVQAGTARGYVGISCITSISGNECLYCPSGTCPSICAYTCVGA